MKPAPARAHELSPDGRRPLPFTRLSSNVLLSINTCLCPRVSSDLRHGSDHPSDEASRVKASQCCGHSEGPTAVGPFVPPGHPSFFTSYTKWTGSPRTGPSCPAGVTWPPGPPPEGSFSPAAALGSAFLGRGRLVCKDCPLVLTSQQRHAWPGRQG